MSARKKSNPNALTIANFEGSPAYELAVVVHRETEAQRAIDAQAFRAQHGDRPQPTNPLMALVTTEPHDLSAYKPWDDYAESFDVLERCRHALGGSLGDVAKRIALELQPKNVKAMFWMATWLQALDHADNLKAQMREQTQAFNQAKEKERQDRRSGGLAKHEEMARAKAFVLAEWGLHKAAYEGNRSEFARHYVGRLVYELGIRVKHKTIAVNWLGGI